MFTVHQPVLHRAPKTHLLCMHLIDHMLQSAYSKHINLCCIRSSGPCLLCRHLIDRMLQSAYSRHGRLEGPAGVPVMTVDKPMYEVCQILGQIQASVLPTSVLKIDHAKVKNNIQSPLVSKEHLASMAIDAWPV